MFFLEKEAGRFVACSETCRSVDCVLVCLSSAFYEIADVARELPSAGSEEGLVSEFLGYPDVRKALAGLAYSIGALEGKINGDPRFKNLRKYLPQIVSTIKNAFMEHTPSRAYHDSKRPPTWRVEYEEHKPREPIMVRIEPRTDYREHREEAVRSPTRYQYPYETRDRRSRGSLSFRLSRSKVSLALYVLLLLINTYVFVGVPWVTYHGTKYLVDVTNATELQFKTEIAEFKASLTGWEMTRFFIDLWRLSGEIPPIFIAYFIGLLLAVIALLTRSLTLSVISGIAMLIGWSDFYTSATSLYKAYIQLFVVVVGTIDSAEVDAGTILAGILAFLQLVVGTYLIYKATH